MRKERLSILLLSAAIVWGSVPILTSCSSEAEENLVEVNKIDPNADLLADLARFNATQTTFRTRGNDAPNDKSGAELSRADKIAIVCSDARGAYKGGKKGAQIGTLLGPNGKIAGAILGGVIVGGLSSYVTYQSKLLTKKEESTQRAVAPPTNLTFTNKVDFTAGYVITRDLITAQDYHLGLSNGLDSCYVEIGIQHNLILAKIDSVSTLDKHSILQNLTSTENAIVNSAEFEEVYNEVSEDPAAIGEISEAANQIINMFISGIESSCKTQEDINRFIKYYTAAAKKSSSLTEVDKEDLYTFFSVAGYSFKYWSETNLFSEEDDENEWLP